MFHLLTNLYSSIAYALTENKCLLEEMSPSFREICLSINTGTFACSVKDQVKHINFAMKMAARLVHHAKFEYNINKTMCQEIIFFWDKLLPGSNIVQELLLRKSYLGCQRSHPLVTVALRELDDTQYHLVSCGTSLSLKRSSSTPSYTSETARMESSSQ